MLGPPWISHKVPAHIPTRQRPPLHPSNSSRGTREEADSRLHIAYSTCGAADNKITGRRPIHFLVPLALESGWRRIIPKRARRSLDSARPVSRCLARLSPYVYSRQSSDILIGNGKIDRWIGRMDIKHQYKSCYLLINRVLNSYL